MSKVKANLIKINLKKGNNALACYIALLNNVEGGNHVYLPNAYAEVQSSITPDQWAGYLSVLTKEGKYVPVDKMFGEVNY